MEENYGEEINGAEEAARREHDASPAPRLVNLVSESILRGPERRVSSAPEALQIDLEREAGIFAEPNASTHPVSKLTSNSPSLVRLTEPRISIAGRYSVDDPHEHPLHSAGHGRRSSLFRQQSNSLVRSHFLRSSLSLELEAEPPSRSFLLSSMPSTKNP